MEQELYELPDGWKWFDLLDVSRIGAERGFVPKIVDGKVPFIGMSSVDQATGLDSTYELRNFDKVRKGYTKFQKNAVLLAKITPCTENNKTALMHNVDGGYATTEVYPIHPFVSTDPHYLLQFFRSPSIRELLVSEMEGATGRQRVPTNAVSNLKIPFPPLSEQKRIVTKLDTLFTRIDTAVTLLQETLELSKSLFASALDELFRQSHSLYPVEKLKYLTCKIGSGATPRGGQKSYKTEGISLIRSLNIYDARFQEKGLAYIDDDQAGLLSNVEVKSGDVLLNITGASVARCCIVPDGYLPARVNQHVSIIRPKEMLDAEFLNYLIISPNFKNDLLFQGAGGATRQALTKTMIQDLEIPLPPIERQRRIVAKLNALFQRTSALETITKEKLSDLTALKASLLDAAFRGQL